MFWGTAFLVTVLNTVNTKTFLALNSKLKNCDSGELSCDTHKSLILCADIWPQLKITAEGPCTVYYSPNEQGTRTFTSWHSSVIAFDKVAAMSFYYRDASVPNDSWHQWANSSVNYLWPKATQSLYSGSNTIQYKFVFQEWTTPAMSIHVEIQ